MDRPGVWAGPRGQWRIGENGENWLQNHLWCPNDPTIKGLMLLMMRDTALRVAEVLCATGGGGISCVCYTCAVRPQKGL